jgi:2-polyprenyl-6-methoxyphenol hydroxylase-like FAD-dependent oxidoreductase
MQPLRIAIAGAGTAGLAAAAFLTRDGHSVQLYERFAEPRPLGAGLMLQPTGLACLARLGLDRAAIDSGAVVLGIDGRTVRGARIFDVGYRELGPRLFGIGMHRGTLFSLLYEEVRRLAVPITASIDMRSGRCVPAGRLLIDAEGNEHGPFDLVIDGTGQRSPLRAGAVEVNVERPYAYGALWGITLMPDNWQHPDWLMQVYDGCHLMVGILPVGRRPGDPRRLAALFWSLRVRDHAAWREGGIERWRAQVLRAWPEAQPFLEQVRSADDLTFASYADITLRQRYADRIVFIGDAGRVTSPQLGQGANLALIDAAVLADCLRGEPSLAAAAYPLLLLRQPLAHPVLSVRQPHCRPGARSRLPDRRQGALRAARDGAHPERHENRPLHPPRSWSVAPGLRAGTHRPLQPTGITHQQADDRQVRLDLEAVSAVPIALEGAHAGVQPARQRDAEHQHLAQLQRQPVGRGIERRQQGDGADAFGQPSVALELHGAELARSEHARPHLATAARLEAHAQRLVSPVRRQREQRRERPSNP